MTDDLLQRLDSASCGGTVNLHARSATRIRALEQEVLRLNAEALKQHTALESLKQEMKRIAWHSCLSRDEIVDIAEQALIGLNESINK